MKNNNILDTQLEWQKTCKIKTTKQYWKKLKKAWRNGRPPGVHWLLGQYS